MESKIVGKEEKKELTFPLIAKCIDSNKTVLFTELQTGTVLISDGYHKIGYVSNGWVSCDHKPSWTILDDVTINFKS